MPNRKLAIWFNACHMSQAQTDLRRKQASGDMAQAEIAPIFRLGSGPENNWMKFG
jgi:hypothetical protein